MIKGIEYDLSETDLAYMAGLLDGEGSYIVAKHFNKPKHCGRRGFVWELRITIGMTELGGLNFMKDKLRKKRLRLASKDNRGVRRKIYYLTFYSNEIRSFLPRMLPYIHTKKKQATLLLNAVNTIVPKTGRKIDRKLQLMYIKMKKLNKSRYPIR